MTNPLEAGDQAPQFALPATKGGTATLGEYAGKFLILFFYPKDDTEGCTREAVAFSGMQSRFTRRKAALLGVSKDSLDDHRAFTAKHKLTVRLGSDKDGAACKAYGVWQMKTLYGRKFMGIVRSTFLIGPDGRIKKIWEKVKPSAHSKEILEELRTA